MVVKQALIALCYVCMHFSQSNTFQGIVITNRSKTYAVYTYHCDDMQWSDGSVIGFNAGGSYYANHPLSDSIEACDIDCVHSPGSEWNNVVYDLTPNTEIIAPTTLSGYLAKLKSYSCQAVIIISIATWLSEHYSYS